MRVRRIAKCNADCPKTNTRRASQIGLLIRSQRVEQVKTKACVVASALFSAFLVGHTLRLHPYVITTVYCVGVYACDLNRLGVGEDNA